MDTNIALVLIALLAVLAFVVVPGILEYLSSRQKKQYGYTVWVGGVEVNDYYLTKDQAERLARCYIADGYDDVQIEKVKAE